MKYPRWFIDTLNINLSGLVRIDQPGDLAYKYNDEGIAYPSGTYEPWYANHPRYRQLFQHQAEQILKYSFAIYI